MFFVQIISEKIIFEYISIGDEYHRIKQ